MTWLVIGSGGQLGSDLMRLLGERAVGLDVPDIDITDVDSVAQAVYDVSPSIVINCAAYTDVDAAETHEAAAEAVNATGTANVTEAASQARLIQLSTDYVFDGAATTAYPEQATPAPLNAYGRTKLRAEQIAARHPDAFIVRTAWLYGATGHNFVKTMLTMEQTHDTISVVDDQIGQPTWSRDLAQQLILLGESGAAPGIYHATNSGQTSWYGFARRIFELTGADPERVRPTTSADFLRPAPRPAFTVLGHDHWADEGLPAMRSWDDALIEALPVITTAPTAHP